jgi:hypothetical protein
MTSPEISQSLKGEAGKSLIRKVNIPEDRKKNIAECL